MCSRDKFLFGMFFVKFAPMRFIWLLLFILPFQFSAQTFRGEHFGCTVGAVLTFGTHVNSIGLSLNGYYTNYFAQVNIGSSVRFNGNSYGKRKMFVENRNSLGLILLGGKKQQMEDFELDGLFHNTKYNYGLAYNYLWYFDNAGTSQRSGGWGVHLKKFSLLLENDVFGGQAKDRFRTGHLAFHYRFDENMKFNAGMYFWTGETANSIWQKIPMEQCPSGFRVLEDLPYGMTSHGIAYGGIQYRLPYGQTIGAKMGIDSEHLRHAFQNRLSHDLVFLPKKMKRNTPHYPRLDEHGCPTFEKEMVRKNRFYFQANANEHWSN
jgi:hypothetical protein